MSAAAAGCHARDIREAADHARDEIIEVQRELARAVRALQTDNEGAALEAIVAAIGWLSDAQADVDTCFNTAERIEGDPSGRGSTEGHEASQ